MVCIKFGTNLGLQIKFPIIVKHRQGKKYFTLLIPNPFVPTGHHRN